MGKSLEINELSDATLLGQRVLVADDEAPSRWSYVGLLRDAGARVTEARDGVEALQLARDHRPDLILADVSMPRLDGLGLCAALRREPALRGVTVVLLSDGEPPQAVWGSDDASRPLVDAVMTALRRRDSAPEAGPPPDWAPGPGEPEIERDSHAVAAVAERENIRAQSTVAMHRDPANRVPRAPAAVWRLRSSSSAPTDGRASGFDLELRGMSRIWGAGFIALLAATIGVLVWSQWVPRLPTQAPSSIGEARQPDRAAAEAPGSAPEESAGLGLAAFSGVLRPGIDPALVAAETQGVLELAGPAEVQVTVDGVDRGPLPLSLVLQEGRHVVRYQLGDGSTVRFYYVKSGATRALRVITRPGGFVDAR